MSPWIIVIIITLLFSGLFSGMEIAFVTSDRVRLELDIKRGGAIASILTRFYNNSA